MRALLIVSIAVLISGCANQEVMMTNDKGEHRYCYNVHNGSISSVGAVQEFNKCLNEAGTAGFRRS